MNYLIGFIFTVKEFQIMSLNKKIIIEIKHPNLIKLLGKEQINNKFYSILNIFQVVTKFK